MAPRLRLLSAATSGCFILSTGAYAFIALPFSPATPATVTERLSSDAHGSPLQTDPHQVPAHKIISILLGTHRHQRGNALFLASSSVQPAASNDPREEPRTSHKVTIELPLGLVLEEMDSNPKHGVVIIDINSEGNAAKHNADIFSKIKSQQNVDDVSSDGCMCIRDKIMSVNGVPCHDKGFDDVISLISSTETSTATFELGRLQESTVVNYYNGICISAKPGESYGFLAEKCSVEIDYECRTGNCQTCMRWMEFPEKGEKASPKEGEGSLYERTILHCVGKVPRRYRWLHVLAPYIGENTVQGDT